MDRSEPTIELDALDFEEGWALYEGILFTGVACERWPDGAMHWEVPYLAGYRHGVEREWYPSGRLKSQREMDAGVVHGTAREWAEDGRLTVEETYDHGRFIERRRFDE